MLGLVLRLPLRLVPRHLVVTVKSGINKGMYWIVGSSVHSCWLGHYELEKQALVNRIVSPGMKILDIGANAGFYTLAFSKLVGRRGHVWAFEPFGGNVANLLRHLELNAITNATLVQAAVSSSSGLACMECDHSNSEWHLGAKSGNYLVPTVELDDLIARSEFPRPDLIKMDVEGAEHHVLEGARRLIEERKTSWLIALHGDTPARNCLALLRESEYDLYELDGRRVLADHVEGNELYATPGTVCP